MDKTEFLQKLEIELKISKYSDYTIRNYLQANSGLLESSKKSPDSITLDDVKSFIASNLSEKSSSSEVLFLAAIKYAYSNILKIDLTAGIKRKENSSSS